MHSLKMNISPKLAILKQDDFINFKNQEDTLYLFSKKVQVIRE